MLPPWFPNETFKPIFISFNEIIINLWHQEWTDSNMRWNISEYNNVKDIRVPPNNLWKPDILMYNRYRGITQYLLPSEAILVSRDLFSFGFWVSLVLHQSVRERCKPDTTRHQHINLAYLSSSWIITSIQRITYLTPNITPDSNYRH